MSRACSTNGEKRNTYRILAESQKERDHYGDQDVGGWIILKLILERWEGFIWLRIESSGGLL
jgi:hypothetical protein